MLSSTSNPGPSQAKPVTSPILSCLEPSSTPHLPSITFGPSPNPSDHPLEDPSLSLSPSNIPADILSHLQTAADHLKHSRLVALPTETVYGLGAATSDPLAVSRVYALKGRPQDNPLIVHISSLRMLRRLIPPPSEYTISRLYLALITAFWPGPLTLLFPSRSPPPAPAPQTTGIRMPGHSLARALIQISDEPVSAPSANSSGRPSPTRAKHVWNDLGEKGMIPDGLGGPGKEDREVLGCILDGGACEVGLESTVVDGSEWKDGDRTTSGSKVLKVLRPGGVSVEAIETVVRQVDEELGFTKEEERTKVWVYGRDPPLSEGSNNGISGQSNAERSRSKQEHRSNESNLPAPVARFLNANPRLTPQQEPKEIRENGNEHHEEIHNPSTPGMKYRHYSPSVPVFLVYPSDSFDGVPRKWSGVHEKTEAPMSLDSVLARIAQTVADSSKSKATAGKSNPVKIGTMLYDGSALSRSFERVSQSGKAENLIISSLSLGPSPESAARILFDGMLMLEGRYPTSEGQNMSDMKDVVITSNNEKEEDGKNGVDAIIIEACKEDDLGLAVMERVNKAVGGGGQASGLGLAKENGERRFWVDAEEMKE